MDDGFGIRLIVQWMSNLKSLGMKHLVQVADDAAASIDLQRRVIDNIFFKIFQFRKVSNWVSKL